MTKQKLTMLYDGDCGFCTHFVEKWRERTGERIIYKPYQEGIKEFPQVKEEEARGAVQLILPDGAILSGAHAVFKALDEIERYRILHSLYDRFSVFALASEFGYQLVAHHRMVISRLFFGKVTKCGS